MSETPAATPDQPKQGFRHVRLVVALVVASLLGTFAVYSGDSGRTYTCPACAHGRLPGERGGSGDEGDDDGGGGDDDDDDDHDDA